MADNTHHCPICDKAFKADDVCATDITEGVCHAACLEGSPVVDPETGEPIDGPASTYPYSEVCLEAEGDGQGALVEVADRHLVAAPVSQEPVADKWAIDNSTDSPILTYEKCSVIQDEQARYVMGLIRRDAGEPSEAEVRQAGDILMQHGLNAPEQVIYGAARALLASKSKGGQADG